MTGLLDHLAKLRRISEGAIRRIENREPGVTQPRIWWDGYQQAVKDVEDFAEKNPIETIETHARIH